MPRSLRIAAVAALALAAGLVAREEPGDARAPAGRAIEVHPGQLHGALRQAVDGDTLVLHHGRYRGVYTIRERLRLIGAPGERRPVIDGRCRTRVTLEIEGNG